jgi:hypothetical protein
MNLFSLTVTVDPHGKIKILRAERIKIKNGACLGAVLRLQK